MPANYWFWGIYILCLVFGGWGYYDGTAAGYRRFGGYFALWVLVGIVGYRVFGSAIK